MEGPRAELDAVKSELERRISGMENGFRNSRTELMVPSKYYNRLIRKAGIQIKQFLVIVIAIAYCKFLKKLLLLAIIVASNTYCPILQYLLLDIAKFRHSWDYFKIVPSLGFFWDNVSKILLYRLCVKGMSSRAFFRNTVLLIVSASNIYCAIYCSAIY